MIEKKGHVPIGGVVEHGLDVHIGDGALVCAGAKICETKGADK